MKKLLVSILFLLPCFLSPTASYAGLGPSEITKDDLQSPSYPHSTCYISAYRPIKVVNTNGSKYYNGYKYYASTDLIRLLTKHNFLPVTKGPSGEVMSLDIVAVVRGNFDWDALVVIRNKAEIVDSFIYSSNDFYEDVNNSNPLFSHMINKENLSYCKKQ